MNYWDMEPLSNYYFEDSFVLDIQASWCRLALVADFVLREDHPEYDGILAGEQYCYKRGSLIFTGVKKVSWSDQGVIKPAVDASKEVDFGGIDVFQLEGNLYRLEGDFGQIQVEASSVEVLLNMQK